LRQKRQDRARLELQRRIDSLMEQGAQAREAELDDLLARKIREARAAQSE
jgi:hypothetical protein